MSAGAAGLPPRSLKVTFVRHAESLFNVDRSNKTRDCGLTETGKQQARDINVSGACFDRIIVSPMRRCRETLDLSSLIENCAESEPIVLPMVREHKVSACDFFEDEDASEVESEEDILRRCDQFKLYLLSIANASLCKGARSSGTALNAYVSELSALSNDERKGSDCADEMHVCVVSHSDFVWYFTSQVHEGSGERFGVWLQNAEARTVRIEIPANYE